MRHVISFFAIVLFFSQQATAAQTPGGGTKPAYELGGSDITPFVQRFKPFVRTLTKPVFIYNWSAAGKDPFWAEARDPNDPVFADYVKNLSRSFWGNYGGKEGQSNMYGYGLYAAVDPVATYSYGSSTWLLLEMELPVGFKLIDVDQYGNPADNKVTDEFRAVAEKFRCPSDGGLNPLFTNGGANLTPECRGLVEHVFSELFNIDGFAYGYGQTMFKACDPYAMSEGSKAFVITGSSWVKPELVRFYNENTTYEPERRARIQTMFFSAMETQNDVTGPALAKIVEYLTAFGDTYIKGGTTKCDGKSCVITVKFCNIKDECLDAVLDPIPRPGGPLITAGEAQKTAFQHLLWDDLDQKPKTATISTWLKQNKYACDGKVPYDTKTGGGGK